ncbi:hypothetical protein V2G26_004618 [Clonostachys chloroleuca]
MDRLFSDVHESAQAAKQAYNDYAKTAGFALIIRNTARHSDGRIKRQVLSCCKGRGYTSRKNPDTHPSKRRSTISQMTACPFRLWVKPTGDNAYFVQPGQSVQHNHDLEKPVAFSAFRRETIELYKDKIIAMHSSGTPPLKISLFIEAEVIKLKKAGKILTPLLPKDISNVIAQYRQDRLEGLTPLQYLYKRLNKDDFVFRDRCDSSGRLISLLIVPTAGLRLLKIHSNILLLDCTYKTNRFNMPLLNIYSVTATKQAFTVASIFLNNEQEATYRWALSTLLDIMDQLDIPPPRVTVTDREIALINALESDPRLARSVNLLCRWHINMNVLAKCKSMFPGAKRVGGVIQRDPGFEAFLSDWGKLIRSRDEATFNSRLANFIRQHPQRPVDYALQTWIYPWKERFVTYLINRHRHLGHVTTSIVESLHGQMKRFLWSTKGDFDTIIDHFNNFWEH